MNEPLVLIPGLMCDARVFGPQLAALSPERSLFVGQINIGERIEDIASALLDKLPQKFALAGLSLGGIVAMELMRRAQDRVTRVAFMDTNTLAETPTTAAEYEPVLIKLKAGKVDEVVDMVMRPEFLAQGPYRAEVLALFRDMAHNIGPEAASRQIRAIQRRRDYQSALRRCKVPAMVLCGQEDGLTPPKRHEIMAKLIPGGVFQIIEGGGHLPTLEQPDVTTQMLRAWLNMPAAG